MFIFRTIKDEKKLNALKKKFESREENGKNIGFRVPLNESLGKFLSEVVSCVELIDLTITEPKLESVVAKIYRKNNEMKKKKV